MPCFARWEGDLEGDETRVVRRRRGMKREKAGKEEGVQVTIQRAAKTNLSTIQVSNGHTHTRTS